MVQPIITSLGRSARTFSTTNNRVISETFKDNKGVTTVVMRVLNEDGEVLKTKMKRIFETVLKNGKRILTRQAELHVQQKIAGTNIPKKGKEFVNKFFSVREHFLSKDGESILKTNLLYEKPYYSNAYSGKIKELKSKDLKSVTFYESSDNVSESIRKDRYYAGKNVDKLQYSVLSYDDKGIPRENNNFDLSEFEIFNK